MTVELAHRESDGIEVALLWDKRADALTICVCDSRMGDSFEIAVKREKGLEAFYHPYAYATSMGLTTQLAA
jgi:hypothetical protein